MRLPIPPVIDEEGGNFVVDLGEIQSVPGTAMVDTFVVSVEDAYGCKRQLSVPGISVNVKRIKVRPEGIFHA